jgi:hypothetical protein
MKYGITFDYWQYYLPTKRHKKEQKRKMVTCRDIEVRELSEKDFPVAIRVTDFDVLKHNWEDETESKYDTIEYRWNGKDLYKEPRYAGCKEEGELCYKDAEALRGPIKNHAGIIYDYQAIAPSDKKYDPEKSVILGDEADICEEKMQEFADEFIICDGKVWQKCGQPYYKVQTFGLGNNHGGTSFFIDWTYGEDRKIDKNCFLASQRDLAIEDFRKTAEGRGDTDSIKNDDSDKRNIEILIPEAYTLKRDLESMEYPGYMWDDDRQVYVKEYKITSHVQTAVPSKVYELSFRHDYGDRHTAVVTIYDKKPNTWDNVWEVLGQVLTDVKNVSVSDIGALRCDGQDIMDCLQ